MVGAKKGAVQKQGASRCGDEAETETYAGLPASRSTQRIA